MAIFPLLTKFTLADDFCFKDTAAFLQSSLDQLGKAVLGDGSHNYHFLKQSSLVKKLPPEKREEAIRLLSLKGK